MFFDFLPVLSVSSVIISALRSVSAVFSPLGVAILVGALLNRDIYFLVLAAFRRFRLLSLSLLLSYVLVFLMVVVTLVSIGVRGFHTASSTDVRHYRLVLYRERINEHHFIVLVFSDDASDLDQFSVDFLFCDYL